MLAKLVAPMDPETACTAFLAMMPMLPANDEAYNRTTLENAARRETGDAAIPNFDKLMRVFGEWRRDNMPAHVRMGGSAPIAQIVESRVQPTQEEIAAVQAKAAALKAELAYGPTGESPKVEPRYLDKLSLARSVPASLLATRPDLRAALDMAREAEHKPA